MFGRRFHLFNLFGFSVGVDLSWFIILLLITWTLASGFFPLQYPNLPRSTYWAMGLAGALGLFVSIILHEFAHAMIARRNGIPMRGITLFIFGGVAEMDREPPSAGSEFRMAIAGPIATVLIAAVLYAAVYAGRQVAGWPGTLDGVLLYLAFINTILVLFNMIPAFPLDGGRVLRSALWQWKGSLRWATRITSQIGAGFGLLLIVLGVFVFITGNFIAGMWWFLIGMFLRAAANMSYQQLIIRRALEGEPVSRFMKAAPTTVPLNTSVAQLVEDYIYKHHYRMFPITSNGHVVGCVTTRKVRDVPREEWERHTVEEIAEPCSADNTIAPDADAMHALSMMHRSGVSRLLVVDEGRLAGVLTLKDLMNFLAVKVDLGEEQMSYLPESDR